MPRCSDSAWWLRARPRPRKSLCEAFLPDIGSRKFQETASFHLCRCHSEIPGTRASVAETNPAVQLSAKTTRTRRSASKAAIAAVMLLKTDGHVTAARILLEVSGVPLFFYSGLGPE